MTATPRPTASTITDAELDDLHVDLASARREAGLLRGERDLARELATDAIRERDSARRWAVALEGELSALHHGEEPCPPDAYPATAGQWIWSWNRATPAQRLAGASSAAATAALMGRLRAERDEAQAAVRKLSADTARTSLTVCGDRNRLAAVLGEVLAHFVHHGHPGEPCLSSGWVAERTVARWRESLNASSQAASGPQSAERGSGAPEGDETPERPSGARTGARNYS